MDGWGSRRVAVEFESEGAVLRGFLYKAVKGEPPFPVVVMTHGTSATIPMVTDRYAEVFAEAGVSALIYDHRNLGISGGEPRQEINPWVQSRGYRDAITFASTIEGHDPTRIGVWGDSHSAGQVFLVAACDARVKVVVAQCPVFGADPPAVDPTREVLEAIRETFESGDVSGGPGDKTGPMPVVSSDQLGTPSLLQPIQAFRWFIDYGGRHGSGWQNHATRINPSNTAPFSPYLCAPYVTVPSLMMVASADEWFTPTRQSADKPSTSSPVRKTGTTSKVDTSDSSTIPATYSTKQARSSPLTSPNTFSPDALGTDGWLPTVRRSTSPAHRNHPLVQGFQ